MSVIISTPKQICDNPLNTSKSKFLYTFSKSSRENLAQKSICNQAFYDVPPLRATRTTGFGYSTKYDFTKGGVNNPPPNTYAIQSIFEVSKKKRKGFSFGLSRDAMASTGSQTVGEKTSPGPAAYDVRELNKSKLAFSFRPRTTAEPLTSSKSVPGPGTYPVIEATNLKGKYYLSKFKGSGATSINPPRSKRFIELKDDNPGPGTYVANASISTDGSYFVSKFKSSLCRTFGHSIRKNHSISTIVTSPGPGSYRLPSDFGYYESVKTANSTMNH